MEPRLTYLINIWLSTMYQKLCYVLGIWQSPCHCEFKAVGSKTKKLKYCAKREAWCCKTMLHRQLCSCKWWCLSESIWIKKSLLPGSGNRGGWGGAVVIVLEELPGKVWRRDKFRKTCLAELENRMQFVRGVVKENSWIVFLF